MSMRSNSFDKWFWQRLDNRWQSVCFHSVRLSVPPSLDRLFGHIFSLVLCNTRIHIFFEQKQVVF